MKALFPFFLLCLLSLFQHNAIARQDTLTTASGLKYVVLEEGSGRQAKPGDRVSVHYTGRLPSGRVFDSSSFEGSPIKFTLGQGLVIKGWEEMLLLMRKGSKVTVVIPPHLAYGNRGFADPDVAGAYLIPPNATLIFDMELVKLK